MRTAFASGLLLLATTALSGCRTTTSEVAYWVDHDLGDVGTARSVVDPVDTRPRTVALCAAANETVAFVIAVEVGDTPIRAPSLRPSALTAPAGVIAAQSVQIERLHQVSVRQWPGWHVRTVLPEQRVRRPWDVVVPLRAPVGGMPDTLHARRSYRFWVDVVVPKGTSEGIYGGSIQLCSENEPLRSIDVSLAVWPFALPDEAEVFAVAPVDHRSLFRHAPWLAGHTALSGPDEWHDHPDRDRLSAMLLSTMRLLRAHRLTPTLPTLAPRKRIGADGTLELDWSVYDRIAESCLDGKAFFNRAPLRAWPLPIEAVFSGWPGDERASNRHRQMQIDYLDQCAAHFGERGWIDRAYAAVPEEMGPSPEAFDALDRFCLHAAKTVPRTQVLTTLFPQDLAPCGWAGYDHRSFGDQVGIWAPRAQFYDVAAMDAMRSAGKQTWLTVDRPPYSGSVDLASTSTDVRILPWQAEALDAEGLRVPPVAHWPDVADTPRDCMRYDSRVLLYPGRPFGLDEPVTSVRLKHLRRGLQDVAYLALLRAHDTGHIAEALVKSLSHRAGSGAYNTHYADGRPNGWPKDAAVFELARQIMAGELAAIAHENEPRPRSDAFTHSVNWQRLMRATRSVEIAVDGTRIRVTGARPRATVELEVHATVRNYTRLPIEGSLRLAELPNTWDATDAEASIHIAPSGARRVRLRARATSVPQAPQGRFVLPVEFVTTDGAVLATIAPVACATVAPVRTPPVIDGDLSDWPAGQVNVLGSFSLVSSQPPTLDITAIDRTRRTLPDLARPVHATTGFVLTDSENLYVGLTCETDGRIIHDEVRRSAVQYDDLIPTGEEMIEILIDPLNAGTRAPADLLHIAVKRSGAYVAERGIRVQPPCGKRSTWPADIEVATMVGRDRWSCEVRIPLGAMDIGATDPSVWGLNLTRYDVVRDEFSTWSGAVHNAYDPLSLGNLRLGEQR